MLHFTDNFSISIRDFQREILSNHISILYHPPPFKISPDHPCTYAQLEDPLQQPVVTSATSKVHEFACPPLFLQRKTAAGSRSNSNRMTTAGHSFAGRTDINYTFRGLRARGGGQARERDNTLNRCVHLSHCGCIRVYTSRGG